MNNITCVGNRAPQGGGCLSIESVTLTLTNSGISENIVQHAGTGIYAQHSRIQVCNNREHVFYITKSLVLDLHY